MRPSDIAGLAARGVRVGAAWRTLSQALLQGRQIDHSTPIHVEGIVDLVDRRLRVPKLPHVLLELRHRYLTVAVEIQQPEGHLGIGADGCLVLAGLLGAGGIETAFRDTTAYEK